MPKGRTVAVSGATLYERHGRGWKPLARDGLDNRLISIWWSLVCKMGLDSVDGLYELRAGELVRTGDLSNLSRQLPA